MFAVRLLLQALMSRTAVIILNTLGIIYCTSLLLKIFPSIHGYAGHIYEGVITALNGIATVFVALGVVYEERETILHKIAKSTPRPYDDYLNNVAHEDGLGLLVLGLFVEIMTISIETPNKFLDTSGVEYTLLLTSFGLIAISIIIQFDLLKDYAKTYFSNKSYINFQKSEH
jgi:Flp pilus assembly pilin Flp